MPTLLRRRAAALSPTLLPPAADGEVAAVVYRQGRCPGALLDAFSARLLEAGFDPVTVTQRGTARVRFTISSAETTYAEAELRGEVVEAAVDRPLGRVRAALLLALMRRPDVIVLNRFGYSELVGFGLLDVLAAAAEAGVPVVAAVPHDLFAHWLRITAGRAIRLGPTQDELQRWWMSVATLPSVPANPTP